MSRPRALVAAPFVPAFDRESGAKRIVGHVEALQEAGWDVTFVARAVGPQDGRYARHLRRRGVATYVAPGDEFEALVRAGAFDVVVCAFWYVAEHWMTLLRAVSPATRIVVDTIDLHFVRHARAALRGGRVADARVLDLDYAAEAAREVNVYAAADAVLAVSAKEAELVNDLVGDDDLAHVVPDREELAPSPTPRTDRRGVVFVGNFWHPPNVDGALLLLREIVPLLRQGATATHPLSLVGNALEARLSPTVVDQDHVHLVGWVPSFVPYLERARVSVTPLTYGAGTKRKLVQALMVGTPTVSTRVGVEGLALRDGQDVLVVDDPSEFAAAVDRLLVDDELWERLAHHGRQRVLRTHGQEAARGCLLSVLDAVLARGPKRPDLAEAASRLHRPNLYRQQRRYEETVQRVRRLVASRTPLGATVAVVSKGDERLLHLSGRRGRHFPSTAEGTFAGHHPADSAAAIEALEGTRAEGTGFLVVPWTAMWWLDYYDDFRRHLEEHHEIVAHEDGTGLVVALGHDDRPGRAPTTPAVAASPEPDPR